MLGVIKNDNSNLNLLKVTLRQVDALQKAGENPNMYLTDQQKRLMEEKEIKDDLTKKMSKTQTPKEMKDKTPATDLRKRK